MVTINMMFSCKISLGHDFYKQANTNLLILDVKELQA